MQKKLIAMVPFAIMCTIILLFNPSVYATDLPIDITAIGRQGIRQGTVTPRIGAHLFTDDSQIVNAALEEQLQRRLGSAGYLFVTIPYNNTIDSHAQVMSSASYAALFVQPLNFSSINVPQDAESIPTTLIVLIFIVCGAIGVVLAVISAKKRKESKIDVH